MSISSWARSTMSKPSTAARPERVTVGKFLERVDMKLQDLDLPYLPMEDTAFASDQYPFLEQARAQHPWMPSGAFCSLVHEHTAIDDLLRRDRPLTSAYAGIVYRMVARHPPVSARHARHPTAP